MYCIYTTKGIVIRSWPHGEANATLSLLTEELGLLRVRAQGVRVLASKMRHGAQELAAGTFSLVRGREVWRLTSAVPETLPPKLSLEERVVLARVLALVERLVNGEEADRHLFCIIRECGRMIVGGEAESHPAVPLLCHTFPKTKGSDPFVLGNVCSSSDAGGSSHPILPTSPQPSPQAGEGAMLLSGRGGSNADDRLLPEELRALELLTVARVLDHLGYIAPAPDISAVRAPGLTRALLAEAAAQKRALAAMVNNALHASQL